MTTPDRQRKATLSADDLKCALPADSQWQVSPAINRKKLDSALQSYAKALLSDVNPDDVLALHDATLFGSGKKEALLTRTGIVIGDSVFTGDREIKGVYIPFDELEGVTLIETEGTKEHAIANLCLKTFDTFEWLCAPDAAALARIFKKMLSLSSDPLAKEESEQPCPFCGEMNACVTPICQCCKESLVESHVKEIYSHLVTTVHELEKLEPNPEGFRTFVRDAVLSGLAGVPLPVNKTVQIEMVRSKESTLAELRGLRKRYAAALENAKSTQFRWLQLIDPERLRRLWPEAARSEYVAWSCPACRSNDAGEVESWIIAAFSSIGKKHACPRCGNPSQCPSLYPSEKVGKFDRRENDASTAKLPPSMLPSLTSTRPVLLTALGVWALFFLNGLFLGTLGEIATPILHWAAGGFAAIGKWHIGGLFKVVVWAVYAFVFLFPAALAAAITFPCFIANMGLAATKRLPRLPISIVAIAILTLGAWLSGPLSAVIAGGWFLPFVTSIKAHPWSYVLPIMNLLVSVGICGAGMDIMATAFCRACKKWHVILDGEWTIPTAGIADLDSTQLAEAEDVWRMAVRYGATAPEQMTTHTAETNCLSVTISACPNCRSGLAHLAQIKPTLYFGLDGNKRGFVQENLRAIPLSPELVEILSNKSLETNRR